MANKNDTTETKTREKSTMTPIKPIDAVIVLRKQLFAVRKILAKESMTVGTLIIEEIDESLTKTRFLLTPIDADADEDDEETAKCP